MIKGTGYFTTPIQDANQLIGIYTELQEITSVRFKAYFLLGLDYLPATEYEVVFGTLPQSLTLNRTTGRLTGQITEMDKYIPEYVEQTKNRQINHVNYGRYGSASLFLNGIGIVKRVYFTVRASRSNFYIEKQFAIGIKNNWSSDRDEIIAEYGNE